MSELLKVSHLKKYFKTRGGLLHAVDDVSFTLTAGKTLGIVGESGCGKSTLGRVVLQLLEPTDGQVIFAGEDITHPDKKRLKQLRTDMQMIFQDPYSSINPRMTVSAIIQEPMEIYGLYKEKNKRSKKVAELMDTVGLADRFYNAYPHELDGGRRQRIGIARALALDPQFIVCDEPVSALDVSIQAQILNLMKHLQKERGIAYIFITHNLSVVKHISDDIGVMYLGQMVEKCSKQDLFADQIHPYTKALLSAIPQPSLANKTNRIILKGELSSPIDPEPCCRFCKRCIYAKERCYAEQPALREVKKEHFVACHFAEEFTE